MSKTLQFSSKPLLPFFIVDKAMFASSTEVGADLLKMYNLPKDSQLVNFIGQIHHALVKQECQMIF